MGSLFAKDKPEPDISTTKLMEQLQYLSYQQSMMLETVQQRQLYITSLMVALDQRLSHMDRLVQVLQTQMASIPKNKPKYSQWWSDYNAKTSLEYITKLLINKTNLHKVALFGEMRYSTRQELKVRKCMTDHIKEALSMGCILI